jgi:hypothetical protein
VKAELKKLTKALLVNIVKYYYDAKPSGLSGMNKDKLVAEVAEVADRIVPCNAMVPTAAVPLQDCV